MSLQDVFSHMDLAVFPEIALFLFAVVFVAVVIRTGRPGRRRVQSQAAQLPLSDPKLAAAERQTS
jgi:cbb3-type cytochrome oxidase subunit 3